ncbi:hypothetical protein [Arachidicoccus soli]|nr:hypothetical protein [Arachidicoccus soli]
MCSKITVGSLPPFYCTSAKWKRSVDNYADSATVTVPALYFLKKSGNIYNPKVVGTYLFAEGMPIQIELGYNGNLVTRFKGFIKRINYAAPLELECEGYSYPLQKIYINKTYTNSSVKKILTDLLQGTGISISSDTADVPINEAVFKNASGVQILEWLKKKCLLTVYFNFNEIYVGLRATEPKGSVDFHIGWNTVNANDLLFSGYKEFSTVRINGVYRKSNGDLNVTTTDGNGSVKTIHLDVDMTTAWQQKIINDRKLIYTSMGYTGKLTAFLEPYTDIGMTAKITDDKYPERSGSYFVESVEGSFSNRGGRQIVGIGFSLN